MYLHFEPSLKTEDESESQYQHHGQGTWNDVQAMPSRKPLVKPTPVAAAEPRQQVAQVATMPVPVTSKDTPAPTKPSNGSTAADTSKQQTTGSSLLAYRDHNEESSDEDESENEQPKASTSSANATNLQSAHFGDEDDDMDPTSAYVATKLKLTSLERKLGLASKPGKKGAKSKPKAGGGTSVESSEMQEYQRLDARLKECELSSYIA